MEIPVLAKTIELDNLYHIYLFYVEERWWAFGCSAYYMSILYPELEPVFEDSPQEHAECIPFLLVSERYLLKLSDFYDTLVSDAYIQISVPPTAYSYRDGYEEWCGKLSTNINSLY